MPPRAGFFAKPPALRCGHPGTFTRGTSGGRCWPTCVCRRATCSPSPLMVATGQRPLDGRDESTVGENSGPGITLANGKFGALRTRSTITASYCARCLSEILASRSATRAQITIHLLLRLSFEHVEFNVKTATVASYKAGQSGEFLSDTLDGAAAAAGELRHGAARSWCCAHGDHGTASRLSSSGLARGPIAPQTRTPDIERSGAMRT